MQEPCAPPCSRAAAVAAIFAASLLGTAVPSAAAIEISATDSGFVTLMGGSAKGDGSVVPPATYNYSVGFEVHYAMGALGPDLAPMPRKNYFVFDLSALTAPLASAKLTLWTGTFESVDPFEIFTLHEPGDMATSLSLAADLAAGDGTDDFDEVDDELVLKAKDLFDLLAAGPEVADPLFVTSALDDSYVDLTFTPLGLAFLDSFAGGMLLLSGFVPSIDGDPALTPQQPFGFTGPDIEGGDPMTPMLVLTPVPEPPVAWLWMAGAVAVAWRRWRAPSREA